jgi:hypothetical protein
MKGIILFVDTYLSNEVNSKKILISFLVCTTSKAATVLWHNLSDGATSSPGITTNVIDQDIDIIGTNAIVDGIIVESVAVDINITVTNSSSVLTGSGNRRDGVPQSETPRLYFFVDTGRTINLTMSYDLTFRGTSDAGQKVDLLVTVSGPGLFNVILSDLTTFSLTQLPTTGGTKFYLGMGTSGPTLTFERASASSADNVYVSVGGSSGIGFLSTQAVVSAAPTDSATLILDGSNAGG